VSPFPEAALLGVVQGLTEFLPVSSSAHLILARAVFGWNADKFGLPFDVACHVGTLVALVVYYRRELGVMLASLPSLFQPARHVGARLVWLLAIGTVPAIVAGLLFNHVIEERLRTPAVAAAMLALGAFGFFVAERAGSQTRSDESVTAAEAFWLGCAQAAALVPGVSRSGATLTVALLLGLRRTDAARFVFLLAIPAVLAATAYEGRTVLQAGVTGEAATLFLVGLASSAVVGYAAVKYFTRYLVRHSLAVFAWYRLTLAAAVVIWLSR
jgi:undecaprenyl-diphosphatase